MKFKKGDKVKVLRHSTKDEEELWGDCWTDEMGGSIGKRFIVRNSCNNYSDYDFRKYKLNDNSDCWFPEFVLEKEPVAGEQLVFSFMKE